MKPGNMWHECHFAEHLFYLGKVWVFLMCFSKVERAVTGNLSVHMPKKSHNTCTDCMTEPMDCLPPQLFMTGGDDGTHKPKRWLLKCVCIFALCSPFPRLIYLKHQDHHAGLRWVRACIRIFFTGRFSIVT